MCRRHKKNTIAPISKIPRPAPIPAPIPIFVPGERPERDGGDVCEGSPLVDVTCLLVIGFGPVGTELDERIALELEEKVALANEALKLGGSSRFV